MINRYLSILVDELRAEGVPDPLHQRFTLAAVWDDLARLGGEVPPAAVRAMLGGSWPGRSRALPPATCPAGAGEASPINAALAAAQAELAEGGVPVPLAQPCTLGFLWADLSRLAGEEVVPEVRAMLDGHDPPRAECARRPPERPSAS